MSTLPPDVSEALRRGEPLEAMRLLRASAQLSLKDARRAIERAAGTGRPAATPTSLKDVFRQLPTAMDRGSGAGSRPSLPPAPPAERAEPIPVPKVGDLSPGEVPRRGGAWIAVAVIAGAALYAFVRLRGG